jgi:ribosome-interacting GTPase 1
MDIALHGMKGHISEEFGKDKIKVIRYADDFVIFVKTLENVQKAKLLVNEFLKPIRLNLSEEKISIEHSMSLEVETSRPIGLDFLSYTTLRIKYVRNTAELRILKR